MTEEARFVYNKTERNQDFSDINCAFWSAGYVSPHIHTDFFEIVIATEKPFINYVNEERKVMSAGDIAIIPPGLSHRIDTIMGEKAPHFNLSIRMEFFGNYVRNKQSLSQRLSQGKPIYFTPDQSFFNFLFFILKQVDNQTYNEIFLTLGETVLNVISSSYLLEFSKTDTNKTTVNSICKDAIWKMDNYSYVSLKMEEIYGRYPISKATFCKEFKVLTGSTPSEYLEKKKLEYAGNLLLTTNLTVLEITSALGYDSVSYFIKKFKRDYHYTPLQFRKRRMPLKIESAASRRSP